MCVYNGSITLTKHSTCLYLNPITSILMILKIFLCVNQVLKSPHEIRQKHKNGYRSIHLKFNNTNLKEITSMILTNLKLREKIETYLIIGV